MDSRVRNELIATTTGVLGIAATSVLNFPLLIIGITGVGLYAGTRLLLPQKGGLIITDSLPLETKKLVEESTAFLKEISTTSDLLENWKLKKQIDEIVVLGNTVLKVLVDDAEGQNLIPNVHRLLAQFSALLKKYSSLSKHTIEDESLIQAQNDFGNLTDKIYSSLQHYYRRGLKSDIQGFDIDMRVVESKIDDLTSN